MIIIMIAVFMILLMIKVNHAHCREIA